MNVGPSLFRILLNLYPPYLFSRTVVKSISKDWRDVKVVLHKSLLTRNYVGTTFGGSLYQAADPFFMLMLLKILGIEDYVVWDQGAEIHFIKPARSKVMFHFKILDDDLEKIQRQLQHSDICRPSFFVDGMDQDGEICVRVKKLLYVRKKNKHAGQQAKK